MDEIIRQTRALLEQFQKSDWRDLYLRTDAFCLFMAKDSGGSNPSLAPDAKTVRAPHLGTVASTLPPGATVAAGAVVVQLEVLGELIEIASDHSGIVAAVLAPVGALVEYAAPLLSILPRETV